MRSGAQRNAGVVLGEVVAVCRLKRWRKKHHTSEAHAPRTRQRAAFISISIPISARHVFSTSGSSYSRLSSLRWGCEERRGGGAGHLSRQPVVRRSAVVDRFGGLCRDIYIRFDSIRLVFALVTGPRSAGSCRIHTSTYARVSTTPPPVEGETLAFFSCRSDPQSARCFLRCPLRCCCLQGARGFVKSLLSADPSERPTADRATSHPWMKVQKKALLSRSLSDRRSGDPKVCKCM